MPQKPFKGILEIISGKKYGFIRGLRSNMPKTPADPYCSAKNVQRFNLRTGVLLEGLLRPGRRGDMQVDVITSVMGLPPREWAQVLPFDTGEIVFPEEKLKLIKHPRDISMRVVDLVCPIGKGQRALIAAPPRTGKTLLLKDIAASISVNHAEVDLVALLVDERPEEITDFKRNTSCTVFASSSDLDEYNHVRVSELALAYARRLVELQRDVVLLLDSLTRLGRTFNLYGEGSGRTMSGGLDSRAMKIPRRLFGSARNIEEGGSLTIIATALIETGSRMDEVIYEEFKGTGNAEVVLDRNMADKRVWPAINMRKTGTRNQDILVGSTAHLQDRFIGLLNSRHPIDAMQTLTRHMRSFPTNELLVKSLVGEM